MKLSNALAAVALAVSGVNAIEPTTTLAPTDFRVNMIELQAYLADIKGHMMQYLSFQGANPNQQP